MTADNRRTDTDLQTHAIIGACMEVHRTLGHGFSETAYQEACSREFGLRGIPFVREPRLQVLYKGEPLETSFRADFLCFDDIILEFKALARLTDNEVAQLLNELKASQKHRGLLINFGAPKLEFRRMVWGWDQSGSSSALSAKSVDC